MVPRVGQAGRGVGPVRGCCRHRAGGRGGRGGDARQHRGPGTHGCNPADCSERKAGRVTAQREKGVGCSQPEAEK